jgi:hypothetical protein
MRFMEWLLGRKADKAPNGDETQPPPSWAGAGPDVDTGRPKTQTEHDLRRVQSQYDPDTDSFDNRSK